MKVKVVVAFLVGLAVLALLGIAFVGREMRVGNCLKRVAIRYAPGRVTDDPKQRLEEEFGLPAATELSKENERKQREAASAACEWP